MNQEKVFCRTGIAIGCLISLIYGSGCAVGNQYAYKVEEIGLPVAASESAEPIGVGTEDARFYVQNGSKAPVFVGLQRGGFGNPFDVTTASGKPFASDVAVVMGGLLQRVGFQIQSKRSYQEMDEFLSSMKAEGIEKGLYILVNEWKTDIYMSITLHYDLSLRVVDQSGSVLASSEQKGTETIGVGRFEKDNSIAASMALSTKLSYLLNSPEVQAALK